jgi:hypothetical protein
MTTPDPTPASGVPSVEQNGGCVGYPECWESGNHDVCRGEFGEVRTRPMPPPSADDLDDVLAAHVHFFERRVYPSHECSCGWTGATNDNGGSDDGKLDTEDAWRTHLADALRAREALVLAEARAEGARTERRKKHCGCAWCCQGTGGMPGSTHNETCRRRPDESEDA